MKYTYSISEPKTTKPSATYQNLVDFPSGFEKPDYRYNYSYWFTWLNQKEDILKNWRSGSQRMVLKENTLYIKDKGREHQIPLQRIAAAEILYKRLILPIITGGIVAPLALISIFSGVLDPWIAAGLLFVGIMLGYYGYTGAYQVQITFTNSLKLAFFIEDDTRDIREFVARINRTVHAKKSWPLFTRPIATKKPVLDGLYYVQLNCVV